MIGTGQLKWDEEITCGKGKAYITVRLLPANFYSFMDDLLTEQIITGDVRTLGMKMGRIKDALVWNGIPTQDASNPRKAHKPVEFEHPEYGGGERKTFKLHSKEAPLLNQPGVAEDGNWMAFLGDRLAEAVVKRNPGLQAKYGDIIALFQQVTDDAAGEEDSEASAEADAGGLAEDAPANPAYEGPSAEPAELADEEAATVGAGSETAGNPTQ